MQMSVELRERVLSEERVDLADMAIHIEEAVKTPVLLNNDRLSKQETDTTVKYIACNIEKLAIIYNKPYEQVLRDYIDLITY